MPLFSKNQPFQKTLKALAQFNRNIALTDGLSGQSASDQLGKLKYIFFLGVERRHPPDLRG